MHLLLAKEKEDLCIIPIVCLCKKKTLSLSCGSVRGCLIMYQLRGGLNVVKVIGA